MLLQLLLKLRKQNRSMLPIRLLIIGDSFACNWPGEYAGWPELLSSDFDTTNIAQAGASEYRIWLQLKSQCVDDFDFVVVSHSSPFRVFVKDHPIHYSGLHANSDLIFNDIDRYKPWNTRLQTIRNWFRFYFDEQYHHDIYSMIRREIMQLIPAEKYICTTHSYHRRECVPELHNIDFTEIWAANRGIVNHYTRDGNLLVYKMIEHEIYSKLGI